MEFTGEFTGEGSSERHESTGHRDESSARSDLAAQIRRDWLAKQLSELEAPRGIPLSLGCHGLWLGQWAQSPNLDGFFMFFPSSSSFIFDGHF